MYLLSPLPGWARPGNEAAEGGDAARPPSIVGGGHLTPVESIKKMLLHVHSVAPLQTAANNGMNSPAAARRLSLLPPGKVMRHFLTDKQTNKQTNRRHAHPLVSLWIQWATGGAVETPSVALSTRVNVKLLHLRDAAGGWRERRVGVLAQCAWGGGKKPVSRIWALSIFRKAHSDWNGCEKASSPFSTTAAADSLRPAWADGSCPLRRMNVRHCAASPGTDRESQSLWNPPERKKFDRIRKWV